MLIYVWCEFSQNMVGIVDTRAKSLQKKVVFTKPFKGQISVEYGLYTKLKLHTT